MMIALAVITGFTALAKRGRGKGRSMGRYIKGRVDEELSLSTLATKTLTATTFDETVNERSLVSSIVATWSVRDATAGEGPILVGVAHGDYSNAEIEEVIENLGSWDEGDKVSQERAKRLVRQIGTLTLVSGDAVLNDGKAVKTKLNWVLNQGVTLKIWAYNLGLGSLTTGGVVQAEGHANLWPR